MGLIYNSIFYCSSGKFRSLAHMELSFYIVLGGFYSGASLMAQMVKRLPAM